MDKIKFLDYIGLGKVYDQMIKHLNKKVDKVEGKGLSTNDFTNTYKTQVDKIGSTDISGVGDGTVTGAVSKLNTDLGNKSTVSLTRNLTSGTKVGTITIDGQAYDLYAPTDTNTWRGIQNNLTSTSTTDSLAAAQGKALNEKITNITPSIFGAGITVATGVTSTQRLKVGKARFLLLVVQPSALALSANTRTKYGSLDADDIPPANISAPCVYTDLNGKILTYGRVQVTSSGEIYITSLVALSSGSYFINASIFWMVN